MRHACYLSERYSCCDTPSRSNPICWLARGSQGDRYQCEASRDYDPSSGLERIRAHVLAINSADDERNPPETGIAQRAVERLANGRFLLIPGSEETRGHGTVGLAALWAEECRAFLESVPASLTAP